MKNDDQPTPPDDLVEEEARQRAVEAVAKIEMDREGYPLARTQEEIYTDAYETVNAVLQALSPHLSTNFDHWESFEEGVKSEREKIVAWLRDRSQFCSPDYAFAAQFADAISRGDHAGGEGR